MTGSSAQPGRCRRGSCTTFARNCPMSGPRPIAPRRRQSPNILRINVDSFEYHFDHSSSLVATGVLDDLTAVEDRVVAVHGIANPSASPRSDRLLSGHSTRTRRVPHVREPDRVRPRSLDRAFPWRRQLPQHRPAAGQGQPRLVKGGTPVSQHGALLCPAPRHLSRGAGTRLIRSCAENRSNAAGKRGSHGRP
jgi:hypothetical protein